MDALPVADQSADVTANEIATERKPKSFLQREVSVKGLIEVLFWIAVVGSLASPLGRFHWMLENLGCFKAQYVWLLSVGALWCAWQRRVPSAIVIGLMALWNLSSYAGLYLPQKSSGGARQLRVMYVNVLKTNPLYPQVADLVAREQPDVLILAEYDPMWARNLTALHDQYAHVAEDVREDYMGMACFANGEVTAIRTEYLGPSQLPSTRVDLLVEGQPISIFGVHPMPPLNAEWRDLRNKEVFAIATEAGKVDHAAMMIGDFNMTSDMAPFQETMRIAGVRDGRRGFGMQSTWPTFAPLLSITLDHALVSEEIEVINHWIGPNIGSDHRPVMVDIAIRENEK